MRAGWHARAPIGERKAWSRADPKPLVFRPVARAARFTLLPVDAAGAFDAPDRLALAREALAYRKDGSSAPVHPRLLALVYRAVLRFEVPYVHVVSGYRPTRGTSRHAQGRAVDLVLPGVSDRGLAAYFRRQGFVGVGLYTASGFVHLDVRAQSYFWVDASAPGGRQRNRRILPELGWRMDAEARRRGEVPVQDSLPADDGSTPDDLDDDGSAPDPDAEATPLTPTDPVPNPGPSPPSSSSTVAPPTAGDAPSTPDGGSTPPLDGGATSIPEGG